MAIRTSDKSLLNCKEVLQFLSCTLFLILLVLLYYCTPCKEILWRAQGTVVLEFQTTADDLLWTKIQFLLIRVHLLFMSSSEGEPYSRFTWARNSRSLMLYES